jgi:hypothetical protein
MMASGRPALATAEPGTQIAEVLSQRGLVTQPGNPEEFASALLRLAESPELRRHLGQEARAYAVSHMDKDCLLRRFEEQLLQASMRNFVESPCVPVTFGANETPDAETLFAAKEARINE